MPICDEQPQTVPSAAVIIIVFVIPPVCFVIHKFWQKRPWVDVYKLMLALAMSVLLTAAVTDCLKIAVSRPRPNFNRMCWPSYGTSSWNATTANMDGDG